MKKSKVVSYCTGALLTFIGVGGVVCGLMMMLKSNGEYLQLSQNLIYDSPFETYFIPGLALFSVNGVISLIGALLSFKNHHYSGLMTMGLGVAMIIWIIAEVYWVNEYSFLQPTMFGIGVIEIILGYVQYSLHPENRGKNAINL